MKNKPFIQVISRYKNNLFALSKRATGVEDVVNKQPWNKIKAKIIQRIYGLPNATYGYQT